MPDLAASDVLEAAWGDGPYRVRALFLRCGGDAAAVVRGGTGYHVGAVSLALYEPDRGSATVSTITAPGHRDDAVSARFAKELARTLRCTVSVTVGVHIDHASGDELETLRQNCEQCLRLLAERLTQAADKG